MARLSKLQIRLQKVLAKASDQQVKAWRKSVILREVLESLLMDENSVAICNVSKKDVSDVLGVNLAPRLANAPKEGINWLLSDAQKFQPTEAFVTHYRDLERFYNADSEPMTRAYLDAYLLEVLRKLRQNATESLKVYGELAVSCSANGKTLNGFGDWFIGYGEGGDSLLKNVALVGEAKDISVDISSEQALCQIFTYMLIIHRIRKEEGKVHAQVYGFITNRRRWIFLWVTDGGEVKRTKEFAEAVEQEDILANLAYIFSKAQQSSPSTTQSTSVESLAPTTQSESLSYDGIEIMCTRKILDQSMEEDDEEEEEEEGEE
ncbi:hypothetical protein HK097_011078 [Rhizophlyctis rosea]|uniref:Uncharacterized protein n=1 Tax=Rhizophlyctis rosea TaxID=64517 RepID=A0AAD5X247_9FUNG|nr:hypothetical protein HK097_011078 [Rhizophlyctis rosea]